MVRLPFKATCVTKEEESRTSITSHTCKILPLSNLHIYKCGWSYFPPRRYVASVMKTYTTEELVSELRTTGGKPPGGAARGRPARSLPDRIGSRSAGYPYGP